MEYCDTVSQAGLNSDFWDPSKSDSEKAIPKVKEVDLCAAGVLPESDHRFS